MNRTQKIKKYCIYENERRKLPRFRIGILWLKFLSFCCFWAASASVSQLVITFFLLVFGKWRNKQLSGIEKDFRYTENMLIFSFFFFILQLRELNIFHNFFSFSCWYRKQLQRFRKVIIFFKRKKTHAMQRNSSNDKKAT